MFKKIVAVCLILCSFVTVVGAADYRAVQNTTAGNIYIEGKLESYEGGVLSLRIYEGDRTCYINEFKPADDGSYTIKFKFKEDASKLSYDLKLNGTSVNDSVIQAYADTSSFINADIFLMDGTGAGLRIDGSTNRMTYIDKDPQTYVEEGETATTHTYEVTDLESNIKADTEVGVAVYPKNELGNDGTGYTVVLAQYGEDERLLSCKTLTTKTMTYYDYSGAMVDCGKVSLVEGVKSVKAFMWDSYTNLTPYTQAADSELEPISVYYVGDSTGQKWNSNSMSVFPQAGIGSFLSDYFNSDYVTFYNKAVSGATAASYLDDSTKLGDWPALIELVKSGDYVIIGLGINDLCSNWDSARKAKYKDGIETMVKETISKNATPILASPILALDSGDAITKGLAYADVALEALEELGEKYGLTVLPIHTTARQIYIDAGLTMDTAADKYHLTADGVKAIIGQENYAKYYALGKNAAFEGDPNYFDISNDRGHLNVYGADFYANIYAELIAKSSTPLKFYLK